MIAGRVEAQMVIPSPGASVSAANSGGGATTATVPAASYFLTTAGGVAGLLATLQTQLQSSRAPSAGSWAVSLSTGATGTGQVTIDCDHTTALIPSFSLVWSNTTLRDVLGFTRDINYATNATDFGSDVGYGVWSSGAGWLCDDASGALTATFGSPSLAATGSPTYSNQGPRGGSDKAVGMNLAGSNYFDGGNVFDASGTDDIFGAAICRFSSAPSGVDILFSKGSLVDSNMWCVFRNNNAITFRFQTGGVNTDISLGTLSSISSGNWFVLMWAVDRSTGKARIAAQDLSTGGTAISTETAVSGTLSNVNTFRMGLQAGAGTGAGTMQCAALWFTKGTSVALGGSANLAIAVANLAATFGAWKGLKQAHGLWMPDSPLIVDLDTKRAPLASDKRETQGPTGKVLALVGNVFFRQRNAMWQAVPVNKVFESVVTYANASLETFWLDTQLGLGATGWFSAGSALQIYDHNQNLLGADAHSGTGLSGGWSMTGVANFDDLTKRYRSDVFHLYTVTFPQLVSSG